MKKFLFTFLFFNILLPIVAQSSPKGYDEFLDNLKSVSIKMGKNEQQRIDKFMKKASKSICASSQEYRLRDYISSMYFDKSNKREKLKILPIYGIFIDDKKIDRNMHNAVKDSLLFDSVTEKFELFAIYLYNDSVTFFVENGYFPYYFSVLNQDKTKTFLENIEKRQYNRGTILCFSDTYNRALPIFLMENQTITCLYGRIEEEMSWIHKLSPHVILKLYLENIRRSISGIAF